MTSIFQLYQSFEINQLGTFLESRNFFYMTLFLIYLYSITGVVINKLLYTKDSSLQYITEINH